jgi:ribonuclease Y
MEIVFAVIIGLALGALLGRWVAQRAGIAPDAEALARVKTEAEQQVAQARREAEVAAREEAVRMTAETEKDVARQRQELTRREERLHKKEETIDQKADAINKKESLFSKREKDLQRREKKVEKASQSAAPPARVPSGWMPCSAQYSSQQLSPTWIPAWPMLQVGTR